MAVYHFVSHTHWDREWYLGFEQFRMKLVAMIDEVIETLESDSSFASFTLDGQTVLLEDYLEVRPGAYERIKALVRADRLSIGPWYVLPDEFLVSGEAMIRNLSIGMDVARRFGMPLQVGYVPDSFGHIAMLPAILHGFGISSAVLYRGLGGRPGETSSEYRWSAPDGRSVLLMHLHKDGYSAGYFHDCDSDEEILDRFHALQRNVDERAHTPHRLLLNGGDHHFIDASLPGKLDRLRKLTQEKIVHGGLHRFVSAVSDAVEAMKLPDLRGELRSGYNYAYVINNGVYSSRMYLKQANWRCQMMLERYLEPVHALAVTRGMTPMTEQIAHVWKLLLKNHPHDSICGCSTDEVHREMMTRFTSVESAARELLDRCWLFLIPQAEGAYGDTHSFAVFNPTPHQRSNLCEVEIHFYRKDVIVGLSSGATPNPDAPRVSIFDVLDAEGKSVPYQIIGWREDYAIAYSDHGYPRQYRADIVTVLLDARNIPPIGWRKYAVRPHVSPPRVVPGVSGTGTVLENDDLLIRVADNGAITMQDTATGRIVAGMHLFEDGGDAGDEYTYSYPERDAVLRFENERPSIEMIEKGPRRASIRIKYSLRVPRSLARGRKQRSQADISLHVETIVSLSFGSRLVECSTTLVNTARDHRLRVLFPTGIETRKSIADSTFTLVERKHDPIDPTEYIYEHPPEVAPMQRFVAIKDRDTVFVLFADGLPEYGLSTDGSGSVALTLLRCVGTLAGDNLITRPGGKAGWHTDTPEAQCGGVHHFRYAFGLFTAREFREMTVINRCADEFHAPLRAITRTDSLSGMESDSLLGFSSGVVVPSTVKLGKTGKSVVARYWNPTNREIVNTVKPNFTVRKTSLTSLDESGQEELRTDGSIISGAKEIVTLLLTGGRK